MKLKHRTILITGGTSGIGRELAWQLLASGNKVIVTGRDRAKLEETAKALPNVHVIQSDAADPVAIETLRQDVLARFPSLDTLINNAGIMRNLRLADPLDPRDLSREIEVCLNGPMWMVQEFLPHLRAQKDALIVNVTSGLAFVPFPASPVYSAAKAALHAYTKCLRAQLAETSISVVELAPPGTETPLFRAEFEKEMQREKGMSPVILAQRAIAGIEAGKTEIRPGLSNVLKIASRVAPDFMFKQMIKLSQLGSPRT